MATTDSTSRPLFMQARKARELFGIPERTLRQLASQGKLTRHRVGRKLSLYSFAELESLVLHSARTTDARA